MNGLKNIKILSSERTSNPWQEHSTISHIGFQWGMPEIQSSCVEFNYKEEEGQHHTEICVKY